VNYLREVCSRKVVAKRAQKKKKVEMVLYHIDPKIVVIHRIKKQMKLLST
jgi:hypothetical protein